MQAQKLSPAVFVRSAIAAGLMLAVAQSIQAQEDALDVVTVTAQKMSQNINDVGMSITALSGAALAQQGITSPDQLVKMVPGLNYTRSTYSSPVYSIRGVGLYEWTFFNSPTVTLYQDETPLPFSAMTRGVVYDTQRVEVLKGPQGTLYGQNSTGGAINFIPNRASDQFATGMDVGYTNFNEFTASGFVSGPLSSKVKARFFGAVENGGAWQQATSFSGEHGDTRFYMGRLLVDAEPTDELKISLNVNGWVDHSDTQIGQLASFIFPAGPPPSGLASPRNAALVPILTAALNAQGLPTDARQANWDPNALGAVNARYAPDNHGNGFSKIDDFAQVSLRADYDLGGTTLTSISSYEHYNDNTLTDGAGLPFSVLNGVNGGHDTSLGQELRAAGRIDRLLWIAGGNFSIDRVYFFGNNIVSLTPRNFTTTLDGGSLAWITNKQFSGFAHAEYSVTDTVSLLAGVRYTDSRLHVDACTFDSGSGLLATQVGGPAGGRSIAETVFHRVIPITPGDCVTLNDVTGVPGMQELVLNQTNMPFTAGVNWKATSSTLLYANVSRGFKAGDFGAVGAFFASQLTPARQEKVTAEEVGVKTSLLDNRLQFSGAFYHYDYIDKQVRGKTVNAVLGLISTVVNVPESTANGVEMDVLWLPTDHWRVHAGMNYIDTSIKDFTTTSYGGVLKNVRGEELPLTPKWQILGDVEYHVPVAGGYDLYAGAHVAYQASTFSGLGAEPQFATPSYTNLDLRAGLNSPDDRWTAQLYVNNVTDRYSWNLVSFASPDEALRYANPPRTYGARVSYRFRP